MSEFILACGTCMLAGFLTTIHPCPLTTNIASISFLSGITANRRKLLSVTLLFITGYLVSYSVLGMIVSSGLLSVPALSIKLQRYVGLITGPLFVFIGMIQADLFNLQKFYKGRITRFLESKRWSGSEVFMFGVLISLSFCPATAALFFGILIPLAVRFDQMVLFPLIYATGASIPIIAVSILISQGAVLRANARWVVLLPVISGWLLIIIGIYISIRRIYMV